MYRIHEQIELLAWKMAIGHKISIDHYYAIVDWSNTNLRMWLSNDTL